MNVQILNVTTAKQKVRVYSGLRWHIGNFWIGLLTSFSTIGSDILQGHRRVLLIDRIESTFVTDLLHGNQRDPLSCDPKTRHKMREMLVDMIWSTDTLTTIQCRMNTKHYTKRLRDDNDKNYTAPTTQSMVKKTWCHSPSSAFWDIFHVSLLLVGTCELITFQTSNATKAVGLLAMVLW